MKLSDKDKSGKTLKQRIKERMNEIPASEIMESFEKAGCEFEKISKSNNMKPTKEQIEKEVLQLCAVIYRYTFYLPNEFHKALKETVRQSIAKGIELALFTEQGQEPTIAEKMRKIWTDEQQPLPTSAPKKYSLRRDKYGYPIAITADGIDLIYLVPSERTGEMTETIIDELNTPKPIEVTDEEIDDRFPILITSPYRIQNEQKQFGAKWMRSRIVSDLNREGGNDR